MFDKLKGVEERFCELEKLLSDPRIVRDREIYGKYMREHSEINEIVAVFRNYKKIHKELAQISKNSLYSYITQVIHDNIGKYYDKYLDKTLNRMKENLQDLQDIVSSVENHIPEKAAMFAEKHVHRFNIRMREKEALSKKKALLADHPQKG